MRPANSQLPEQSTPFFAFPLPKHRHSFHEEFFKVQIADRQELRPFPQASRLLESLGQNRFVKVPPTQIAIRPDAAPFLGKSSIQDSMITH